MNKTRNRILSFVPAAVALSAIAAASWVNRDALREWFAPLLPSGAQDVARADDDSAAGAESASGGIAHWTCSMHPSVRSDGPGTCPICSMDLTPVTREEIDTGVIVVDAQRRQLIGVKTGPVQRLAIAQSIRTVGRIVPDESRLTDVTLKLDAWIGEVTDAVSGKFVEKGQVLFTFYSPELLSAQREYIEAVTSGRSSRLVETAEARLRLWGMSEDEVLAVRDLMTPREYLQYVSPASGTILEKRVVNGTAVGAGDPLYRIADLSSLWIEADLYEYESALVHEGQAVHIELSYLPGREFEGTVALVYPYLNADTRTGRIRIEVENAEGVLKPDMYANVSLDVELGERVVVPESAVIYAGKTRVAFVDLGEGRLQPRRLRTGARTADWIEVLDGLEVGETVVTSANFLIAAESKLKSGIDRW